MGTSTATSAIVPVNNIADSNRYGSRSINATASFRFDAPDAPLPNSRQLSKILCRVIDDDAYTKSDSLLALHRVHQWALRQDVVFGNSLVSVGGIPNVLWFVQEHEKDPKTVADALVLLEALTTPLDDNESQPLKNMRQRISQCIVEEHGIELLLRTTGRTTYPWWKDRSGGHSNEGCPSGTRFPMEDLHKHLDVRRM